MLRLTFHGQACFEIASPTTSIIVDPFLNDNPLAEAKAEDVHCDAVLVTHGHGDHLGDAIQIARRNGAIVVGTYELAMFLQAKGVDAHPMHVGGAHEFPFGRVKLTPAAHGGMIDDESGPYMTVPCGFLIEMAGKTVYHAGDTGLLADMEILGRFSRIDAALLPIGDNFTMGPEDALIATKLLKPKTVIPMHYNTYDVIQQDPEAFARRVKEETPSECVVLAPGESVELPG